MVIYSDVFISVVAALLYYDIARWFLPRALRRARRVADVFCGTFGIHWCGVKKGPSLGY